MKHLAHLFPFVTVSALIMAASCGCANIKYENGATRVSCNRAFWKTESYTVEFSTNGLAKMSVNQSGVDTQALNSAITSVVNAAVTSVK